MLNQKGNRICHPCHLLGPPSFDSAERCSSPAMGCLNAKQKQCLDSGIDNSQSILPVFRIDTPQDLPINNDGPSTTTNHEDNDSADITKKLKMKSIAPNLKFDTKVTAKYSFKQSIGKGRYSRVWLVENRLTKQPYAMKIATGKEGKEIYQNELAVLGRIRHPNIIQLIETFETTERFYMVLQLATGGDLFDRVVIQPRGHFQEWEAARIMKMVLDGVRYLHHLGITHRDLKPDNLLFYHPGPDSKILITDFVIANVRKSDGNNFMQTGCGTPEYLAPEVLSRKPYTSAVDLWAAGVVTYIMLSGTFPFMDDENLTVPNIKLYKLILRGSYSFDYKVWETVGSTAKDFISKLLVVQPERRMTATEALQHPWLVNCQASSTVDGDGGLKTTKGSSSEDTISSQSSSVSASTRDNYKWRTSQLDTELSILKQSILEHHRFPVLQM